MFQISFEDNSSNFLPGVKISGTVHWRKIPEETDRIEIRLIWYTSGKGDRDIAVVDQIPIDSPPTDGDSNFEFIAPERPFSFSGKLISLTWAIEVIEFPGMEAQQKELFVGPIGREISLYETKPSASIE